MKNCFAILPVFLCLFKKHPCVLFYYYLFNNLALNVYSKQACCLTCCLTFLSFLLLRSACSHLIFVYISPLFSLSLFILHADVFLYSMLCRNKHLFVRFSSSFCLDLSPEAVVLFYSFILHLNLALPHFLFCTLYFLTRSLEKPKTAC